MSEVADVAEEGRVIDARSGATLTPAEVTRRLVAAQVVLVGEEHAEPMFHAVQREVLERVEALAPARTAMGIEWLPRSTGPMIEVFLSTSPPPPIAELRALVDWDKVWGHTFDAYAPLFESARRMQVPVVPLNAEPGLARFVARGGVAGVPPERAAELPSLDSGNEAHREWFRARMQVAAEAHPGHAMSGEAFDRMYVAQLVWDETMAASVVAAAASRKVVVFAGLGHIEHGLGIPARLGPSVSRLIVVPVASIAQARQRVVDGELPEREADLFWVVRPALR